MKVSASRVVFAACPFFERARCEPIFHTERLALIFYTIPTRRINEFLFLKGDGSRPPRSMSKRSNRQDSHPAGERARIRDHYISINHAILIQDEETARPKLFYSKVCGRYFWPSLALSLRFSLTYSS